MSRQTMKITIIFSILIFASGCVRTLDMDSPSEKLLSKLAYPAPDDRLKVLRSAHFVRAIAWYGLRSVNKYSQGQEEREKDAYSILKKMQDVQEKLNQLKLKVKNTKPITATDRFSYVEEVLELIGRAAKPTKRYYENNITALIASQNPVAAAVTFKEAIMGFVEVKSSQDKFKAAIRKEYIDLFIDAKSFTKKTFNKNWDDIVADLGKKTNDLGSAVEAKRAWYRRFLEGDDIKTIVDSLKKNENPKGWLLDLATIVSSQGKTKKLNLDPKKLAAAWESTTESFNEYCKELKVLAGTDGQPLKCNLGK
jgi:hypothetical protein